MTSLTYVLCHVLLLQIIKRFSLSDLVEEKRGHVFSSRDLSFKTPRFVNACFLFHRKDLREIFEDVSLRRIELIKNLKANVGKNKYLIVFG